MDVRVFAGLQSLSAELARALAGRLGEAVGVRGAASIALAGGRTPEPLYERLALHHPEVPWARVQVFWGDERYVAPDDEGSNYRMAREALLDRVPVPAANVHRMPTGPAEPGEAATAYERVLRVYFDGAWPRFDVVLLGLGDDGHTASLFPGSPVLDETARWVVPAAGPSEPRVRLTLTLPAIVHAAAIDVIVSGGSKAGALHAALTRDPSDRGCPAAALKRTAGTLVWWADEAAAAGYDRAALEPPRS